MDRRIGSYVAALAIIWTGSFGIAFGVTEWRAVPGPQGPVGEQGPQGQDGPTGSSAKFDRCAGAFDAFAAASANPDNLASINARRAAQTLIDAYCNP